jgi:hypothetical protein
MRFLFLFLHIGIASLVLCGCDQRQSHRVTEIRFEYATGNTQLHSFSYNDDNQLDEVEITEEGETIASFEYAYEDSQIAEIEYQVPGQNEVVYEFEWEDAKLVEKEETQDGSYSAETEYDYLDNGMLSGFTKVTSSSSETVLTTILDYDYDDENRLEEWKETQSIFVLGIESKQSFKNNIEYDGDGRLEEVNTTITSTFSSISDTASYDWEYEFTDEGRVEEVESSTGRNINFEYDDQNRIEEIDVDQNDLVITYEYEDGASPSIVVEPSGIEHPFLFDLSGKSFTELDMRSHFLLHR